MKLISFAVPCYNSESYMNRCIDSLLTGGEKIEIIIINDGSSDHTASIADAYKEKYPDIIKVIHKENGGHGSGIMAGLSAAEGLYYKVVDSDDWANPESLKKILDLIEDFQKQNNLLDLIVCNYVYEHEARKTHTVHYRGIFPRNRVFTWDECGTFDITRYMIMHSVFYRTDLVKECQLDIPLHTFYVDNIYLYYPLPLIKSIYYCDTDFYRYFIGRSDQSVNEKVMIKRVDQQILVSKLILEKHDLPAIKKQSPKLYRYMLLYASIMVLISALLLSLDGSEESLKKLKDYWRYIKENHPKIYPAIRYRSLAGFYCYTSKIIRFFTIGGYRIVGIFYKFN
ncbi:MAG: glycosyltransferase family 2 protein [Clostridia bacterium]|nr:glycosyltransferase family 2 protein [Clostridia bacterium]